MTQLTEDGSPAIDAQTGTFELIHEHDVYSDYEAVGSDTIRGWYRVTLNADAGIDPGESDYCITLDGNTEVRLNRSEALQMIAGKWFPGDSALRTPKLENKQTYVVSYVRFGIDDVPQHYGIYNTAEAAQNACDKSTVPDTYATTTFYIVKRTVAESLIGQTERHPK